MKENMPKGNSYNKCLQQNKGEKHASSNLEIDLIPEV